MWHGRGNSGGFWPPAFPARLDAKAENNIALKLQFYKKNSFSNLRK